MDQANGPEGDARPHSVANESGTKCLEGVRVLLVEDGLDNQRLVGHYLHKEGALVTVCPNGLEAVRSLCTDRSETSGLVQPPEFEIILMDMQMPEMDGYTAARTLRSKGCTLPIVAITAHTLVGDRERCIAAGCSEYTTKPIDKANLIAVMCRAVRGAPATTTERGPRTKGVDA